MGQASVLARRGAPRTGELSDESCGIFSELTAFAGAETLVRFIVGEDHKPQKLSANEIDGELGDPFATLLLAKGTFPRTAAGVFEAVDATVGENEPLGKNSQMSFILGEGSQIPFNEAPNLRRSLRFVVTRGRSPDGPELIVSAFQPDQADDVELMAWDAKSDGFNFYRSLGEEGSWVFAGKSRDALVEPSQRKGPFESHKSGTFLMKELRAPWINWHSPDANIFPTVFSDADPRREHPWFTGKVGQGALVCETSVARPAITRWTKARFTHAVAGGGTVADPGRIMEQILDTPTVNLMTSHTEGKAAANATSVDLPERFFVDAEGLSEILGLQPPPAFAVSGQIYQSALETFDVKLSDGQGFERVGETHFAFVIPERAFEDEEVLRHAIEIGLVSRRLAAALLMTDFPNPVFSVRRAKLLEQVPKAATVANKQSTFSEEMAQAILAAADGSPEGSPEREFAERWAIGEQFEDSFNALLQGYYQAVEAGLQDQERFNEYFRLAESRRQRVKQMPIFENPLLFATTNVSDAERTMRVDGRVEGGGT